MLNTTKNPQYLLLLFSLILSACTITKEEYLQDNRLDLNAENFDFPQKDFNLIGFGAYHGSAKTEDVELILLHSLTKGGDIKYYFPEVDFSTAHFFNKFLHNGDTSLLKALVTHNGYHTPQERTIEFYHKWLKLKAMNDNLPANHKIQVIGTDWIRNYKYVSRHILELVEDEEELLLPITSIKEMVANDTTSYARGDLSDAYGRLKNLVDDFNQNPASYFAAVENPAIFQFILKNIERSLENKPEREKIIFENYIALDSIYDFKNNPQFMRIGFFHLEKSREGKEGYPSFFARLIEQKIYPKTKLLSVIGFFTDSKVVWDEIYDENGQYKSHTVEAGYGIGDYDKEYFRGIQRLKDAKVSDKTLFRLNQKHSPYCLNEPDLIEIVMQDDPSNGEAVRGMSTLAFLDYAVLISDSKASTPIFEMK